MRKVFKLQRHSLINEIKLCGGNMTWFKCVNYKHNLLTLIHLLRTIFNKISVWDQNETYRKRLKENKQYFKIKHKTPMFDKLET